MKQYPFYESKEYPTVREMIEDIAERFPDRNAFSYRNNPHDVAPVRLTYSQLRDDVRALGTEFVSRNMTGKYCAIIGKLSYPWVCTYFSLLSVGAVLVPLDKDWNEEDLAKTVAGAGCEYLFCDAPLAEKAEAICREASIPAPVFLVGTAEGTDTVTGWMASGREKLEAGDTSYFDVEFDTSALSLLVFTSGTTGSGKGVMLSQRALLADLAAGLQVMELSTKTIAFLPPHHTYGSSVGLLAHVASGCEVYLSDGLRYVLKELREEQPEHLTLVPLFIETFYRKLLSTAKDQGKDKLLKRMMTASNAIRRVGLDMRRSLFRSVLSTFGGKLRMIISGGAPISQEIIDTFEALGITILNGYGITECCPLVAVNRPKYTVPGSVGTVLPCNQVKICEPNGDGEGEICIRGTNVMMGYYQDEAATRAVFDEENYFHTGDYGKFDENGILYITGRLKNLIILSNGKNVYPEEIESELITVPGVIDVVVYEGKSRRGVEHNAIVAEIYPDREYLTKAGVSDVQEYFQNAVDRYNRSAVPYKKISILRVRTEEFPKNTVRKILRFRLDMTID